ncbi:MAG: SpoIIE family protein phosphatase, partial [Deltaproteobacteria bacterium]|nr:SpoIIE family protein phosphatase [Deltaproteobacteria bacterium]
MFKIKSLQQRLALYMLLPVTLLLLGMGFVGFLYAKKSLLDQWGEAAILKLQRAAHRVDMQLSAPKELLKVFNKTGGIPNAEDLREIVVEQLDQMDAVARVRLTWMGDAGLRSSGHMGPMKGSRRGMMRFHQARVEEITPPRYDSLIKNKTVSLISELKDPKGQIVGRLEVVLRFNAFVNALQDADLWQGHETFLVDDTGTILTGTTLEDRQQLGDTNNPLELETLKAIKEKPYGTILGPGHPPSEVIGFYRLEEAPWNLVMIAPGEKILSPITRFRNYYFLTGGAFILFILILIRWVAGRTVSSIKDVSRAAESVAKGRYGIMLPVKTQDEVGELTRSFNTMVIQLEERSRLKKTLDLAMEVQQNLLPKTDPIVKDLDIAGKSIYCDETGGDYYDFLKIDENESQKIGVVVGDVSDHGIPSALLMATVRASLRQRSMLSNNISSIVTDVNRQLAADVEDSGRFMTLFFLSVDLSHRNLKWVRAGHDPAILYDPKTNTFENLMGPGLALGVDQNWQYEENKKSGLAKGQIILLGTDGIWEARNANGDMYGKKPLYKVLRQNS